MPYLIVYLLPTREHFQFLSARQRSIVLDGVESHLSDAPTAEARNRKLLRANPLASWELRLRELRVYYDVEQEPNPIVKIVAVGIKRGNEVIIGGERVQL